MKRMLEVMTVLLGRRTVEYEGEEFEMVRGCP